MLKAIIFDLFETLVTESLTRPAGVSSLAPAFGCEREAFRRQWKPRRSAVTTGQVSFRQALTDVATALGGQADAAVLERVCDERTGTKARAFAHVEPEVLTMLDDLRSRNLRLGVISNCFAEDVTAWPRSPLAARVDCAVFSCEAGLAKPDSGIYEEALRRLAVDASDAWFIGDGQDDELAGAERGGLRAFKALWFLRRWPHYREEDFPVASFSNVEDVVRHLKDSRPQGQQEEREERS
jgi:FMN phosphatase YigB (HAD superfamily)